MCFGIRFKDGLDFSCNVFGGTIEASTIELWKAEKIKAFLESRNALCISAISDLVLMKEVNIFYGTL